MESASLNRTIVAIVALVLSVVLFFGLQWSRQTVSLGMVAEKATPYPVAMANGRPTIIEFYADWCESCQTMAKTNWQMETTYGDQINFVMLNVDNNKWLPELTKYRVDGIPRFIFLDRQQNQIGDAVGIIPGNIMEANIKAMVAGQPLPHNNLVGNFSNTNTDS